MPQARLRETCLAPPPNPSTAPASSAQPNPRTLQESVTGTPVHSIPSSRLDLLPHIRNASNTFWNSLNALVWGGEVGMVLPLTAQGARSGAAAIRLAVVSVSFPKGGTALGEMYSSQCCERNQINIIP